MENKTLIANWHRTLDWGVKGVISTGKEGICVSTIIGQDYLRLGGKGIEGKRGDAGSELAEFSQTDGEPLRKYKFPSFLVQRMASFQYSKWFYLVTSHLDDSMREKQFMK